MDKGKFIVMEGIDGAGKSLQTALLISKLQERGIPIHATRECSDGPIGRVLRDTYLSGKRKCDERVINFLYAADRLDHITNDEDGMIKFIDQGISVLSDRYVMSSLAYDTYMYVGSSKFGDAMNDIVMRNRLNLELLSPDITIFLHVDPHEAIRRITSERVEDGISVYETYDKLEKISKSYNRAIDILRNDFGHRIEVVDEMGDIEAVSSEIWDKVSKLY